MKKEIADAWVKALRSGEYEQGYKCLYQNNTYCCLGVLCDLAEKEKICKKASDYRDRVYFDEERLCLPESVIEWSGMLSRSGERAEFEESLADLNDSQEYSFEEIANIIEKEYENL